MNAYHIIGLTASELGGIAYGDDPNISSIAARFKAILQAGVISPRCDRPSGLNQPDRSTWEDDLAGDRQYVFLSVGERYSTGDMARLAFGFIFDAEALIYAGASLGLHDLAPDYTAIVGDVAEEIAATLPRLPRISDKELAEFAALIGESDPDLLAAVAAGSTDPEYDLLTAIQDGDLEFPGCQEAIETIKARIAALHAAKRLTGQAALDYLFSHPANGRTEILWPGSLPLSLSIGYIKPE